MPGGPPGGPQGFSKGAEDVEPKVTAEGEWGSRITDLEGDNGVRMGKRLPGYAKGTSNVGGAGGAIGKDYQGSLGQGPGKPTPTLTLAKGTSKVPGKPTHPSVDTVNAKLPPGGAVLTNDAANHVGRGLIAHLNAVHAGMPPPHPAGIPPALMAAAHAAQGGQQAVGDIADRSMIMGDGDAVVDRRLDHASHGWVNPRLELGAAAVWMRRPLRFLSASSTPRQDQRAMA